MWLMVSSLSLHKLHLLWRIRSCLDMIVLYRVVLRCYLKRFCFSLKVSLAEPWPRSLTWDVSSNSLQIIMIVFLPILVLSGYFRSVVPRVVKIVSVGCNQSFFELFYEDFVSLYKYIDCVFNACKSSLLLLLLLLFTHNSFSHERLLMVFHWSLRDSKCPQVSRTLLRILTVLNNAVVKIVYTRPSTSKSSSPFNNPLVTVPKVPITIGIIVTFMFHNFFNFLQRSRYLPFFSYSFIYGQPGQYSQQFCKFSFLVLLILFIGLEGKVFTHGPGDRGSIPGHVIQKTLKMELNTSWLNTQQYKVRIKGKVEQSWKRSNALHYTTV